MAATTPAGTTPYYFIPSPSRFPAQASLGLFFVILGAGQWVNGVSWGAYSLALGMVIWLFTLYQWFSVAIAESESGLYSDRIDVSFRWSMSWFIFSEVMFFAAFFGALYWARVHSVPMLGNLEHQLLWPDFKAVWPSTGAGFTARNTVGGTADYSAIETGVDAGSGDRSTFRGGFALDVVSSTSRVTTGNQAIVRGRVIFNAASAIRLQFRTETVTTTTITVTDVIGFIRRVA